MADRLVPTEPDKKTPARKIHVRVQRVPVDSIDPMPFRETTRPDLGPSPAEPLVELFQAHRQGLAGAVRGVLGRGADVAEVLQEAFAKAWPAWRRDGRPCDPVAWMFVVTLNTARDARRRSRARRERTLDEEAAMELQAREAPAEAAARNDALAAARAAIEALAGPEKEVFLLRVSGGLTFAAAAAALGIPVGTAKTRMRKALHELRAALRGIAPGCEEHEHEEKR